MSIGTLSPVGGLQPVAVAASSQSPHRPIQPLAQLMELGQLSVPQLGLATLHRVLQHASSANSLVPAAVAATGSASSGGGAHSTGNAQPRNVNLRV